jgi:hypothetical protein
LILIFSTSSNITYNLNLYFNAKIVVVILKIDLHCIWMRGVVGYLTTYAGVRLPGDIDMSGTKFSDIGAGWDGSFAVPVAGAIQVLLFVGALELAVMKDVTGESEFPGDFRNGALDFGWDSFDADAQASKRAIELNNGRAAQMGLLGLMVHDKLGNVDILIPN